MKKKILINARYPEEKRVAIVEGETLVDFYIEVSGKEHLKGNIYKGVVVRTEPGLQAAFVDFGPKKHGFLQVRELTDEYAKDKEGRRLRIQEALTKGQEIIVQVEKDERDTKGASLTTYVSLPGRYIVMMPGQDRVGVSRKIEDREDRERLKELFSSLKLPKKTGFILRTACSERTGEELENDLKYLTKLWTRIKADVKKTKAPALIYKEQDIAVRTVRDYLTSDVGEVLIDDENAFKETKAFLKKTQPWVKANIKLYKEAKPIFAKHGIEEQISKMHDRHVHLPSRGYLVIDKAEALTAIDVNSGRSRKEENIEGTAVRTNLEAAEEIARQLRLRDIGGLIVIDFIDMESSKHRREVEGRLKSSLSDDKAHVETTGISKFGLLEMTRERMRPAYFEAIHRKCDVCGGLGTVKTDEMIALGAFREMQARAARGWIKSIKCRLPVGSMNYLVNTRRSELDVIEKEYKISVSVLGDPSLAGQFVVDVEKVEGAPPEEPREKKVERHEKFARHERPSERHEKPGERRQKPPEEKGEAQAGEEHQEKRGKRRRRRRRGRGERPVAAVAAETAEAAPIAEGPLAGVVEETAPATQAREAGAPEEEGAEKRGKRRRRWHRGKGEKKTAAEGGETSGQAAETYQEPRDIG